HPKVPRRGRRTPTELPLYPEWLRLVSGAPRQRLVHEQAALDPEVAAPPRLVDDDRVSLLARALSAPLDDCVRGPQARAAQVRGLGRTRRSRVEAPSALAADGHAL